VKVVSKNSGDLSARPKLLSAAMDLFNRRGYASTTVREIVLAAGVTKPVLYYYFGNKEGIYVELMQSPLKEFGRLLAEAAGERGTTRARVLSLCDRVFALFEKNIPTVRLMNAIYYGPPQGAPFIDIEAVHLQFQALLKRVIQEGVRKGEIRKGRTEESMWAVIGALNIAMEVGLCHPEMAIGRKGLARIVSAVFDGLGPARVTKPRRRGDAETRGRKRGGEGARG
jgi:AcrR family transcriptional regulator